jgi:hypothetical protein
MLEDSRKASWPCHCVALHRVALQEEIAQWRKARVGVSNRIIRGRPSQALPPVRPLTLASLILFDTTFAPNSSAEIGLTLVVCLQSLPVIRDVILACVPMISQSRRNGRLRGLDNFFLEGRNEALLLEEFLLAIAQLPEEALLLGLR